MLGFTVPQITLENPEVDCADIMLRARKTWVTPTPVLGWVSSPLRDLGHWRKSVYHMATSRSMDMLDRNGRQLGFLTRLHAASPFEPVGEFDPANHSHEDSPIAFDSRSHFERGLCRMVIDAATGRLDRLQASIEDFVAT